MDNTKRGIDAYKKANSDPAPAVTTPKFSQFEKVVEPPAAPITPKAENNSPEHGLLSSGKLRGEGSLRKVAKFLLLLGKDEAAKVLKHLPPEEVQALTRAIQKLPGVERVEAEALLKEFGYMAAKVPELSKGGKKAAADILEKAFGAEKAKKMMEKAVPGVRKKPFDFLSDYQAHQLKLILGGESVLVITMVLPHLEPQVAASYVQGLSEEQKVSVIHRMAKMERISRDVIQKVEEAIKEKAKAISMDETTEMDGKARLGDILKFLSPMDSEVLLSELEDSDPDLARTLRNRLFTQERILQIRDLDLEIFMRNVEDEDIALLVQALPPESGEKILKNISERRRLLVNEEIQLSGPASKIESQAALREFLVKIREALKDGEMRYLEEDEDYV